LARATIRNLQAQLDEKPSVELETAWEANKKLREQLEEEKALNNPPAEKVVEEDNEGFYYRLGISVVEIDSQSGEESAGSYVLLGPQFDSMEIATKARDIMSAVAEEQL